eukprot:6259475-Lingulodinium_polyedra.AAC.1
MFHGVWVLVVDCGDLGIRALRLGKRLWRGSRECEGVCTVQPVQRSVHAHQVGFVKVQQI